MFYASIILKYDQLENNHILRGDHLEGCTPVLLHVSDHRCPFVFSNKHIRPDLRDYPCHRVIGIIW